VEFHNNPKVSALVTLAVACFAFQYFLSSEDSRADPAEYNAMLGSWTDADGRPGNSLAFYLVQVPAPKNYFGLTFYEGHARFIRNFGAEDARATWNYGSHRPVEINITFADRTTIARIKVLDHDHLLFRLVDIPPYPPQSPDFFDDPGTLHLFRTAE
jgi:hypothetical protein